MSFERIAIIGLGLLGGSLGLAIQRQLPTATTLGYDADPAVRDTARARGLVANVCDDAAAAVAEADLVLLCVPVGAMGAVAAGLAPHLRPETLVSDVGSCKASVTAALQTALPGQPVIPAHPVAGTERSGPEAGFASLFEGRWCILTPPAGADPERVQRLSTFWETLGSTAEVMSPEHHDLVLAITSHLPHLIAYTIVGTASDMEEVTRSEVIKYSAGGFRDFTRIAASDPTMWRDVFLNNREAVLEMLGRFSEDLAALQRAIRWGDGDALFDLFTRTRDIRRGIVEEGQDEDTPDFGRKH